MIGYSDQEGMLQRFWQIFRALLEESECGKNYS